ncbi:MAG: amidohydrolase family protein [Alphaproteobacteria bacterium]
MRTIDADAHVLETPYTWEFMDEADRKYTPMIVAQTSGAGIAANDGRNFQKEFWISDGRLIPKDKNVGNNTPEAAREMRDVAARLKHMDELEIDVQVLYPTFFIWPYTRKAEVQRALVKGYNRWLAEIWKKSHDRLRWVAMVSTYDLSRAREELSFAKAHGACGVYMRGLEADRKPSDPYFFPLYAVAEEMNLPICFHSAAGSYTHHDFFIDDSGFNKFKLSTVGGFHMLVMDGVPAMFPKLRWGFVEVSAQWLPYMLNDLALRFKRRGKRLPASPLAANNMYVACQVTDDLPEILRVAGEDNLVVGTDYGHHDTSTEIEALRLLKSGGKIPPAAVDKILGANAKALYGL